MNTMKKQYARVIVGVVVMFAAGYAFAVANYSPAANLTERWTSSAGWVESGDATLVWTPEVLSVSYSASSSPLAVPIAQSSKLYASDLASSGRFVGDYISNRIDAVAFDVRRDAFTGAAYFYFKGNGHMWKYPISLPEGDGAWAHVSVPLSYSTMWVISGVAEPLSESMKVDLSAVTEIGIRTSRLGVEMAPKEGVSIDNLKLVGPWGGPFTETGLSMNWVQETGLAAGQNGASDDPDHDGFSNYGEFMAGTDPNDGQSFFRVDISRNAGGQTVLRWKNDPYRTFDVLQSTDLSDPNAFGVRMQGIKSATTQNEVVIDETQSGPYFYKVEIR